MKSPAAPGAGDAQRGSAELPRRLSSSDRNGTAGHGASIEALLAASGSYGSPVAGASHRKIWESNGHDVDSNVVDDDQPVSPSKRSMDVATRPKVSARNCCAFTPEGPRSFSGRGYTFGSLSSPRPLCTMGSMQPSRLCWLTSPPFGLLLPCRGRASNSRGTSPGHHWRVYPCGPSPTPEDL